MKTWSDERIDAALRDLLTDRAVDVRLRALPSRAAAGRLAVRLGTRHRQPLGTFGWAWVMLLLIGLLAALAAGAFVVGQMQNRDRQLDGRSTVPVDSPLVVGQPAPPLKARLVGGGAITPEVLAGRPALILVPRSAPMRRIR